MAPKSKSGSIKPRADSLQPVWSRPVQFVKGIGPKRAQLLHELGIETAADLLLNLPRRYLDRSNIAQIGALLEGQTVTVVGKIAMTGVIKGGKTRFEATIVDGTGQLSLLWFAGWRYLQDSLKKGVILAVSGNVTYFHGFQILHPELEILEDWDADDLTHTGRVIPVYPSGEAWRIARLESRNLRRVIKPLIDSAETTIKDYLPQAVRDTVAQPSLPWSVAHAHFPETADDAEKARVRLAFDEFFFLELTLANRRSAIDRLRDGRACPPTATWARTIVDSLPWPLTGAQKRVTSEITADLRSEHPMRRLLQGDVGSGKTVVAALAMAQWAEAGAQAALLVPTEILAEQHHHTLTRLFAPCGITPVLLTGSVSAAERKSRQKLVASGEARIIVGTHALLSEGVDFHDLGMVVIDEQHRFGVAQRQKLVDKGRRPDLLIMTATPIPRTLAMTLYGDLDVSVLNEKPPQLGRVRTVWRGEDAREKMYNFIHDAGARGDLTYIVYPLVEQSEKSDLKAATEGYEALCARFPNRRVGIVHGRIKATERLATMERFYHGDLDILVSTTVIEVGVDAPAARLMVIENAERFGLSQLHQLRGRIGRGPGESICVLMLGAEPSVIARERLEVMCRTNDGFEIAETDLRLRGPGEFLGTRQHGLPEFQIADLLRDSILVEPARKAAWEILKADPKLSAPDHLLLREEWLRRYSARTELLEAG